MKFSSADKRYLTNRKRVSEKYGTRELWSVIDHWPLYCGIANLGRFMAISDIVRSTLRVPGHVAEFGSWRGANLLFMAKLLRIYDPHGPKIVHCFDSFQGLTEFSAADIDHAERRGQYKGSLEELRDIVELYEMGDEIVIHQGLIEETLKEALAANAALTFSLVYCDTDLYESTRVILDLMHPRLAKGGVFVLDEWNLETFPGEGKAVNEFLSRAGESYQLESVPSARQPTLVMRKVRP